MAVLTVIVTWAVLQLGQCEALTLDNGLVRAEVDQQLGLLELTSGSTGQHLLLAGDAWALDLDLAAGELGSGTSCNATSAVQVQESCNVTFECAGNLEVIAAYRLPPGGEFIEKRLGIHLKGGRLSFRGASLYKGLHVTLAGVSTAADWHVQQNPFDTQLEIAGFLRWGGSGTGVFVSVANPWGHQLFQKGCLDAGYKGSLEHDADLEGQWLWTEPAVLGPTSLTQYSNEGLNTGERMAFMRCVESYHLDQAMRKQGSVKVNVAWDENEYQIDAATEEGRLEYRRIIQRNAEFGVTHLVYEPQNSLHSNRSEATDGWGWEEVLWFSMGIQLRKGTWDPRSDDVPGDVLEMLRYASSLGVKFLAYVYPCLGFQQMEKHFVAKHYNLLSLAPREVQDYWIEVMSAFLEKTGAGGFAWDHDIFAGPQELAYGQWRGWMRILATLRERFPDLVMDHRQTAHHWGPWYQLAGSYDEPIAGDENPETYGVPITSLHTDHVAADNTRRINYIYSTQQLVPPSRVPGFIFHQSERTDDDGISYCTGAHPCVNNSNTRDFDYLGYKYSLLSTVGTAGLNNVLCMIPARDPAEFSLLPKEDLNFIHSWLAWTDQHLAELGNTQWIPTLTGPQLGSIDGTHAMHMDEGYIFLFNPNMGPTSAVLAVDESLGLSNASRLCVWDVQELFPRTGQVSSWRHGDKPNVTVEGSSARVLQLRKRPPNETNSSQQSARLLHAGAGLGQARLGGPRRLEIVDASGPAGRAVEFSLLPEGQSSGPWSVFVNGASCSPVAVGSDGLLHLHVTFAGPPVQRGMLLGDTPSPHFQGGWFATNFSIPLAVKQQLKERALKYPVPWSWSNKGCGLPHCVDDSKATWLIPTRLLLTPFLAKPKDDMDLELWIDGKIVELRKSYNSRGLGRDFLGFYYDASLLEPEVPHSLRLRLPNLPQGAFQGIFWENVETVFSQEVVSCHRASETQFRTTLSEKLNFV